MIGLKTAKGTKQLKLDPSIYESLQKEKVEVGDIIYIESNSGAVKVVIFYTIQSLYNHYTITIQSLYNHYTITNISLVLCELPVESVQQKVPLIFNMVGMVMRHWSLAILN